VSVPVFEFVGDCVLVRDTVGRCVDDLEEVPEGAMVAVGVCVIVIEDVPVTLDV
jgi:hypothetical protein